VTSSSAQFSTTMILGGEYEICATTDLWYRADSSNPTAAANTDNNHFLARGCSARISGNGYKVAVIRDTADGYAELSQVVPG
jgi:hypothetical protein